MKKIRYLITVVKIFTKNQMQNNTYLFLDMFNMISRCLIVFLLYDYVFKANGGSINGVDYKTTMWSMFIYFCIMILNIRRIDTNIMNDVKSGNVEMFLNKPVNYVLYSFYRVIGMGLYSFLVISFIGSILMIIFIGLPNVNLLVFISSLLITFIFGSILGLILYSIVGLLAFFMQDIRPIHWIIDKFVMVLGGSYLPVALFPKFLKVIAYISPFGAVNFATSTVYKSFTNELLLRVGIQVFWIIVGLIILRFVYIKSREKSMINGG